MSRLKITDHSVLMTSTGDTGYLPMANEKIKSTAKTVARIKLADTPLKFNVLNAFQRFSFLSVHSELVFMISSD
ncbi:MAG: hypothetical protein M0R49_06540 [Limnochordia bacterium]|nr:hypothetical protein [Limnochordia bacterium]